MPPRILDEAHEQALHCQEGDSTGLEKGDCSSTAKKKGGLLHIRMPMTVSLPLLVFLDMFAVSLVVPLLFQYYKTAGVTQASQREWLSSLFSISQIVGGLGMGLVSKVTSSKTLLYVSFAGSALSYALVVHGGLTALLLSRVIVGLVKQTMTITTTLLTQSTTHNSNSNTSAQYTKEGGASQRTRHLGRLTAASTVAWIVGPSIGALLYKHVDPAAPALCASLLFCLCLGVAALVLPEDDSDASFAKQNRQEARTSDIAENGNEDAIDTPTKNSASGLSTLFHNVQTAFSSRALGAAVLTRLLFTWVTHATSNTQLGSYYEDMYGLEPHQRGYLSSYQQCLRFLVQSFLVQPVVSHSGDERSAIRVCAFVVAASVALESFGSFALFLTIASPLFSLGQSVLQVSLQSLVTHVAPQDSMFAVLAALDVLLNAVSATVPFYRTTLFRFLQKEQDDDHETAMMQGDPDPKSWVWSSALHWLLAAVAMSLLLRTSTTPNTQKPVAKQE